ncbi:MAG: hypothetical protein ABSG34_09750 [Candidatus Sulfotelmatobacter sp.]
MTSLSTSAPSVRPSDFRFRCIACGDLSDTASQNFRCAYCEDLLEITYPDWKESRPDAAQLKSTWRNRRLSPSAIDLSGIWRFRDLLPALENDQQAINVHASRVCLSCSPSIRG